jgi:glycogen synthase
VETYWRNGAEWKQLVEAGMRQDWSWKIGGERYVEVYSSAIRRHAEERERLHTVR